jgi:hypothetical protein
MSRSDQRSVSITIGGQPTGVWDAKSGGTADSSETKYHEGGGGAEVSLGGKQMMENLTCARLFKLDRDLPKIKSWMDRVGKDDVEVVELFLDRDGNVASTGITYKGVLKSVQPPEHDSESEDAARVEIVVSVAGKVA